MLLVVSSNMALLFNEESSFQFKKSLKFIKIKTTKYVFGGDGGNRTHVQKHRHLSVYERSRYIRKFATASAYRRASVQLV